MTGTDHFAGYRISRERDVVPAEALAGTGWLRVFVTTEATRLQARVVTRQALDGIAWKPDESITAAGDRLIDTLRAVTVDLDGPHASEMSYFWPYLLEENLEDLKWHLSVLVTPLASECISQKAIVVVLIHLAGKEFERYPIVPHDPMSAAMRLPAGFLGSW